MTCNSALERLGALSRDKAKLLELLLERKSNDAHRITPYPRDGSVGEVLLPTSAAQQRLWFIEQLKRGNSAYNIPVAIRMRGELDRTALQMALDAVVKRHESLRTVFIKLDDELMQQIAPQAPFSLARVDLSAQGVQERESEVFRQSEQELATPFDLSTGPLIRGRLLRLAENEHILLVTMHHIVSDGWSIGVLMRELGVLYEAYRAGQPDPLSPLPIQYADYSQWQRQWMKGAEPEEHLTYWMEHLRGAPELLELPTDRPRPAVPSYVGATTRISLEPDLVAELKTLSRRFNLTLAMTLHTAWSIVLARLSGQEDIVVGMPVANRRRTQLEGLIGFFVNTLAVRVRLEDDTKVAELLQRVKEIMLGAYAHQDAPFEQVVEALQPARSLSHNPIFQVMFALQNTPRAPLQLPGLTLTQLEVPIRTAKFDLAVSLYETAEGIVGTLNYACDLFDPATTQRWVGCFESVLKGMVREPNSQVSRLPLMNEEENRRVIQLFNKTQAAYPQQKLVHELFEEQVERTPAEVAVVCGEQQLTYAQLNSRANKLACTLLACGVEPDARVALYYQRSVELVVGLLAILKAGGAYVPLDVSYPAERLVWMLRDSAPVAILTESGLRDSLPASEARVIAYDASEDEIGSEPYPNLDVAALGLTSRHLAYVIYTSGSTGVPKGVMVEHHNLANLVHWHCTAFDLREGDRCSCVAPLGFDAATWEIWPPLTVGATLVVASSEVAGDAEGLLTWWAGQRLAVSFLPTPIAEIALSRNLGDAQVRTLLIGGDRLRGRPASQTFSLINNYGPTEATVVATSGRIHNTDTVLHIGRPIGNAQIYILDRHLQALPVGVSGEIYIGGAGVARGYLNRPELTEAQFLPDPYRDDPLARMYRTGDLGRWRGDGTIEYLGRNDHQVKIRGFRIELGEIEAQLAGHERLSEAVVIAREDAPGEIRLVAYAVAGDQSSAPNVEELRSYLKAVLPEYMVPSAFVMLERMPLTRNGKVDRRALPAPKLDAYASREYEAPEGEVEEILAGVWQELLRVERVGRHDNFFELGGHSLLIVKVLERLRRVGLSADVRCVFESPTLADLASALTREAEGAFEVPPNLIPAECKVITPSMLTLVELDAEHIERIVQSAHGGAANVQDIYPLAPLQEGILFHHLLNEQKGDVYVVMTLLSVSSRERLDELITALQSVIDRHDVLRTAVLWEQLPRPVQVVHRNVALPVKEVELDPDRDPVEQVKGWLTPERQRLDLRHAPLMRLQIATDHSGRWYAALQLHHILVDGQSLKLLISEVVAKLQGHAESLPAPLPYRNHVAQTLSRARASDVEAFFRSKLGEIDEPTTPFGLLDVHGDGSQIEEAREQIDRDLARGVRTQARRLCVSAATLFHAAWGLVVAHTSCRDDVVFGTVLLGRLQGSAGAQRTLGMFINTVPLRLRLQGVTVRELVEQTQRELVEVLSQEQASLAVAQRCSGIIGSAPLFSALLNFRHSSPDIEAQWSGADGVRVLSRHAFTNYPITLSVDDLGEGFTLVAQTDRRIDPHRMTAFLHTALRSLVDALAEAPQTSALALSILPQRERHRAIELFNATQAPYPREKLIHELFEDQARHTPKAVAVVFEGQALTYADLNSRANQLARYLRRQGIGPDQLVGICVERSIEMVVGLLGILKAGGAYVPLDPNYPTERLRYMLEDAAPRVVLTQKKLRTVLPAVAAEVIELNETLQKITDHMEQNLAAAEVGLTARNLVYVIYTSGSTGRPKGTAMPHRSMVNLIEWHRQNLGLSEGQRVLQFAALSFDVAFQEIFSTLGCGGTLVLVDDLIRRDAEALAQLLRSQSIQRLFVPPLMLQSLAEHCTIVIPDLGSLRDIITAGEQLRISPEIVSLFTHLDGCRLHNHYGPTETHVVTALTLSGSPQAWPVLPTIGRPIANTRIYVLDGQRCPMPAGVPGEIYIAGANVAYGYLNRPELTAERFMPDPFSADAEARMYRTGDLGRWLSDGMMEYLGRNDDQVKIRGYRIELGEIEAQLARHTQVREAVVVAREDVPGGKRLVAYVTPRDQTSPNMDELRAHLKVLLPEHMVPSAFVVLDDLPLTPSGKLNRRALPAPAFGAYAARHHEPPRGEVEEALACVWQELLHVSYVGREDSFFDLGGHSLLVLKALFKINQSLGCALKVTDVYKSPTIRELAILISGVAVQDQPVDLSKEAALDGDIIARQGLRRARAETVMLTGGTGFVGRFLLAQLLQETDATIYCLVKESSRSGALSRIRTTLAKWDLWRDEYEPRIVTIPGDLRLPRLGIDERTYEVVSRTVDSIYHCATSMNHLETYSMAKLANVESARELLKLATNQKTKLVNYISTLGVFRSATTGARRIVDEMSPIDDERHWDSLGYVASKWVGEKIFMTASERGIPCNIFRLGLVWADMQQGRYDELQRGYRILKSCLLSGYGIRDYRFEMPPTPIDYVARAIVFLGNRHADGQGIFHISAPGPGIERVFEQCNDILATPIEIVPYYEWITEMKRLHHQGISMPVTPLIEYAFAMDEPTFHELQRRIESTSIRFDCARTRRELEHAGIVTPTVDSDLLGRCVESMLVRDVDLRGLVDGASDLMLGARRGSSMLLSSSGSNRAFRSHRSHRSHRSQ